MYVFDTSSFSALFKFYPSIFTSLWENVDNAVNSRLIISVSEAYIELEKRDRDETINEWLKNNKHIFIQPNIDEAIFLGEIFTAKNGHFQTLIDEKKRLKGGICADPFIIAKAKITKSCVVTEEFYKPHASKIPNVCEYFNIEYCTLEEFMKNNDWKF